MRLSKPQEKKRNRKIMTYATHREFEILNKVADRNDETLSRYILRVAVAAAEERLKSEQPPKQ